MRKFVIVLISFMFLFAGTGFAVAAGYDVGTKAAADADAASDSKASISTTDNSKNKVTNRQFVNPGVAPMPMTNGFFTAPTPDSSFRSIKDILRVFTDGYEMRFSEGALESMAKGGDLNLNFQVIRETVVRVYNKDNDPDVKWLHIGIEAPQFGEVDGKRVVVGTAKFDGLTVTSMIDAEADDAKTNSLQVIGAAGLAALKDGNNFMVLTAEGAHRKVEASGWGIGFYTTGGQVSDGGTTAGIIGGGTGYSKNQTGTEDRPWIQGYAGCKKITE